jgi:hypothetical protein
MNAGVRREARSVEIVPVRAAVPPSRASTVNRSVNCGPFHKYGVAPRASMRRAGKARD